MLHLYEIERGENVFDAILQKKERKNSSLHDRYSEPVSQSIEVNQSSKQEVEIK